MAGVNGVPLIGTQAAQRDAAVQALYRTIYLGVFNTVAGVRLRDKADSEWSGEKSTPASIAEEARELAIAALNDLLVNRPNVRFGEPPANN